MTLRIKLFVLIAGVIIFAMSGVTAVALWREVVRGQELLLREGVALASTAATGVSRWVKAEGVEPGGAEALPAILERLVATAPRTGANSFGGDVYRTTGPAFGAVPFDPAAVVKTRVGSLTLTFADGNNATFAGR